MGDDKQGENYEEKKCGECDGEGVWYVGKACGEKKIFGGYCPHCKDGIVKVKIKNEIKLENID